MTLVDEADPAAAIAAAVLMAAPVRAPILISGEDGHARGERRSDGRASTRGAAASTGGAAVFAIGSGRARRPGYERPAGQGGDGAAASGGRRIADAARRLAGSPPEHIVIAPLGKPGFAMPAAAWAARSGDPVLFAGRDKLPEPTAEGPAPSTRRCPSTSSGPPRRSPPTCFAQIAKIARSVRRVSGEDPVANAIALARYGDGDFGWNINDPGHGFVVARADEPLDAAAASPLSAAGTWGPLLLTDDAGTLPAALRGYLLDVKPGYTEDPTRAFYNHVWVIGDQEAIEVGQQAEIDSLAELAKIGGN